MDPTDKPKGPSPHYSLYQRDVFKRGGETGTLPSFSVHPEELQESTKKKLNDRGYFYANSNAGLGWTDRANREAFYRWRIIPRACVDTNTRDLTTTIFGHKIPAPIMIAPIGINKLYTPLGELVPARVAGELGIPYCLSTAASQPIEDVARANDEGASEKNESNSVHEYNGPNGGDAKSPRFFQLYMGHDDEITLSLLNRAWKAGFDAVMLTTDTWQLGWRPTDINIANYVFYYPGAVGNEIGTSDPVFMAKHGKELEQDSGKWIDSSVWHGKAHTLALPRAEIGACVHVVEEDLGRAPVRDQGHTERGRRKTRAGCWVRGHRRHEPRRPPGRRRSWQPRGPSRDRRGRRGQCVTLTHFLLFCQPTSHPLSRAEMTILYDSGVRTGADVFKALALGAHAVMVGRLYVWGMAHEGVHGCRHVLKSLLADLDITMTVAGYRSITKDVWRNRDALRYSPSGVPPGPGEHAKL